MAMTNEERREKKRLYMRSWCAKHPDYYKDRYHQNPSKSAKWCANWRAKNRKKLSERQKLFAAANPGKLAAYRREYWRRPEVKERDRLRKRNTDRRQYYREYVARRSDADANYKLRGTLRHRIWIALQRRGISKAQKTIELVGCDIPFLRGFLEARFQPGMTWENHGKWHIDHVIPCAEFDLRDQAQQRQCFHYSNLKPLWSVHNIAKGAKSPGNHQAELI